MINVFAEISTFDYKGQLNLAIIMLLSSTSFITYSLREKRMIFLSLITSLYRDCALEALAFSSHLLAARRKNHGVSLVYTFEAVLKLRRGLPTD